LCVITLQTRLGKLSLSSCERSSNQFCLQLISIVRWPKGQSRVKDVPMPMPLTLYFSIMQSVETLSLGHNKMNLFLDCNRAPFQKCCQKNGASGFFGGPVDAQLQIHPKDTSKMCGSCRLLWEMLRYSDTRRYNKQHQQPTKHVQNFFFDSPCGCCVLACAKRIMLGCANYIIEEAE